MSLITYNLAHTFYIKQLKASDEHLSIYLLYLAFTETVAKFTKQQGNLQKPNMLEAKADDTGPYESYLFCHNPAYTSKRKEIYVK